MKIGIDTNIFINLFESSEDLAKLRDVGFTIYTHPKCLWEMVKYVKTLELEDKYTEGVVMNFMKRNGILLVKDEAEKQEIQDFEEKCKKAGIECHYPDSEIILAFKKEGAEKVYSKDVNFRKAAGLLGMKSERFEVGGVGQCH